MPFPTSVCNEHYVCSSAPALSLPIWGSGKKEKKSFDSISFLKDFLKCHHLLLILLELKGAAVFTPPTAGITQTRNPLSVIATSA